jgi:hypothetical protein
MSRIRKAALILDSDRRDEQIAFVSGNAEILQEIGEQLWVSMPEAQADRFAERGISVLFQEGADLIELPAVAFDPAQEVPDPPRTFAPPSPPPVPRSYGTVALSTTGKRRQLYAARLAGKGRGHVSFLAR